MDKTTALRNLIDTVTPKMRADGYELSLCLLPWAEGCDGCGKESDDGSATMRIRGFENHHIPDRWWKLLCPVFLCEACSKHAHPQDAIPNKAFVLFYTDLYGSSGRRDGHHHGLTNEHYDRLALAREKLLGDRNASCSWWGVYEAR